MCSAPIFNKSGAPLTPTYTVSLAPELTQHQAGFAHGQHRPAPELAACGDQPRAPVTAGEGGTAGRAERPPRSCTGPARTSGSAPCPATPVSDALDFKIIDFRSISKTIFDEAGIPVSRNNSFVNYSFSWIVSNLIIKIIPRAGPGWCLGSREPPSTFPTGTYSPSRGRSPGRPRAIGGRT